MALQHEQTDFEERLTKLKNDIDTLYKSMEIEWTNFINANGNEKNAVYGVIKGYAKLLKEQYEEFDSLLEDEASKNRPGTPAG